MRIWKRRLIALAFAAWLVGVFSMAVQAQGGGSEGFNSIEFARWLGTLGVGGLLAWGMFQVYRKDVKVMEEAWKGQTQILMQVVRDNTAAMTSLQRSSDQNAINSHENTEATLELRAAVETLTRTR